MNCKNHPQIEAVAACVSCGNFFCEKCIVKDKRKNYCKNCVHILLGEKPEEKKANIVQTQQQGFSDELEIKNQQELGKWFTALFFMGAGFLIFLYKNFLLGIILFIIGLLWIDPIDKAVNEILKNKYGKTIPLWIKIIVTIILFLLMIIMVSR